MLKAKQSRIEEKISKKQRTTKEHGGFFLSRRLLCKLTPWGFMRDINRMRNTNSSECLKNYRFFHIDN